MESRCRWYPRFCKCSSYQTLSVCASTRNVQTGLFSASVATFIGVSIQDLRPNSQDISAFYLANIYQVLADVNRSGIYVPPTPAVPPPFSPSTSAIWVNCLWFLSLVMSLTCALLATLLQQWARRYLWVTQPRCSPHRRSRIRSFFTEGVDKLHLPWAVEILPTLLHSSLFLFFSGLAVFLFNIHHTVFSIVLWWVGLLTGIYICITFTPIFRQDSPYYTPLSRSAWFLVNSLLYMLFRFLSWLQVFDLYNYDTWRRLLDFKSRYLQRLLKGLVKAAEETAHGLGSAIDGRALSWMFESLDEDHELEHFFAAIPDFCNSGVVLDPINAFIKPNDKRLSAALIGFMGRTLSSNLLSESVKQRRTIICRTAVDATSLSASQQILERALHGLWDELFYSVDLGFAAKRWCDNSNPRDTFHAKCVVARVLSRVRERDERWLSLALDQFGVSRSVLQRFLARGDSVLLANLSFITREIFLYHLEHGDWPSFHGKSLRTIEQASRFNPQPTLPEVQRRFCDVWNQLVLTARNRNDLQITFTASSILNRIRRIYISLHEGIDDTPATLSTSVDDGDSIPNLESLYPLCNTHSHVPTLTPMDLANPFPESVAYATEDITNTPVTSPAPTPASQSAHLTLATANISHSPPATAAPMSGPPILPHT
jgi:Family of unknown function (DUF6535)